MVVAEPVTQPRRMRTAQPWRQRTAQSQRQRRDVVSWAETESY